MVYEVKSMPIDIKIYSHSYQKDAFVVSFFIVMLMIHYYLVKFCIYKLIVHLKNRMI